MVLRNVEAVEADLDISVIRSSIDLGHTMIEQILQGIHHGTEEVQSLLSSQCDYILECKICRNLFRSFANLVAHKRVYCTEICEDNVITEERNPTRTSEESVVITPTAPEEGHQVTKTANTSKKAAPNKLKEKQQCGTSKSLFTKVDKNTESKTDAKVSNPKIPVMSLTAIPSNPNAVLVTPVSRRKSSPTKLSHSQLETEMENRKVSAKCKSIDNICMKLASQQQSDCTVPGRQPLSSRTRQSKVSGGVHSQTLKIHSEGTKPAPAGNTDRVMSLDTDRVMSLDTDRVVSPDTDRVMSIDSDRVVFPDSKLMNQVTLAKNQCEKCGAGFKTQFALTAHLSRHGLIVGKFKCSECSKKFFQASGRRRHYRLQHSSSNKVPHIDAVKKKSVTKEQNKSRLKTCRSLRDKSDKKFDEMLETVNMNIKRKPDNTVLYSSTSHSRSDGGMSDSTDPLTKPQSSRMRQSNVSATNESTTSDIHCQPGKTRSSAVQNDGTKLAPARNTEFKCPKCPKKFFHAYSLKRHYRSNHKSSSQTKLSDSIKKKLRTGRSLRDKSDKKIDGMLETVNMKKRDPDNTVLYSSTSHSRSDGGIVSDSTGPLTKPQSSRTRQSNVSATIQSTTSDIHCQPGKTRSSAVQNDGTKLAPAGNTDRVMSLDSDKVMSPDLGKVMSLKSDKVIPPDSELMNQVILAKNQCEKCGTHCKTQFLLTTHLNRHGLKVGEFKCLKCPKKFFHAYSLKRHYRSNHKSSSQTKLSDSIKKKLRTGRSLRDKSDKKIDGMLETVNMKKRDPDNTVLYSSTSHSRSDEGIVSDSTDPLTKPQSSRMRQSNVSATIQSTTSDIQCQPGKTRSSAVQNDGTKLAPAGNTDRVMSRDSDKVLSPDTDRVVSLKSDKVIPPDSKLMNQSKVAKQRHVQSSRTRQSNVSGDLPVPCQPVNIRSEGTKPAPAGNTNRVMSLDSDKVMSLDSDRVVSHDSDRVVSPDSKLMNQGNVGKHKCKKCGAHYKTQFLLTSHLSKHGLIVGEFNCPKCPKKFFYASGLRRHYRLNHKSSSQTAINDAIKKTSVMIEQNKSRQRTSRSLRDRSDKKFDEMSETSRSNVNIKRKPDNTVLYSSTSHSRSDEGIVSDSTDPLTKSQSSRSRQSNVSTRSSSVVKDATKLAPVGNTGRAMSSDSDKVMSLDTKFMNQSKVASKLAPVGNTGRVIPPESDKVIPPDTKFMNQNKVAKHRCKECGAQLKSQFALTAHLSRHGLLVGDFKCPKCPKKFFQLSGLNRHLRIIHTSSHTTALNDVNKNKSIETKSDSSGLPSKTNAKVDSEWMKHCDLKRLICFKCDSHFQKDTGLKLHMKSHGFSVGTLECPQCGLIFCLKKSLKRHLIVQHSLP